MKTRQEIRNLIDEAKKDYAEAASKPWQILDNREILEKIEARLQMINRLLEEVA